MARRAPPPVYVAPDDTGATAVYVRAPLAPETIAALQEHHANASRLFDLLLGGAAADPRAVLEAVGKAAEALERDLAKLRARRAKKRR